MKKYLTLATGILLCLPLSKSFALPVSDINQLVVFGDSLSDNGNAYFGTGGLLPAPPLYTTGRFTDGPDSSPATTGPVGLWVDQLSAKLGVADPLPGFASSSPAATNYAVGTAKTGTNPLFPIVPLEAPGTDQQVSAYLGSSSAVSPNSLYVLWAGANDLTSGISPATAVNNLVGNITTLANAGAKNFLWVNLPPLGDTPNAIGNNATAPLNAASGAFDQLLQSEIPTLEQSLNIMIIGVDTQALFNRITNDYNAGCTVGPNDPYCFANVNSPAQGTSVDPNTYLFWDSEHPTTAAHALIADLAYNDIVGSAAVPEPGTVALEAFGLFIIFAAAGWSKRSRPNC